MTSLLVTGTTSAPTVMIFNPSADLPATYLTSFYLAPGHDKQIIELSRFPAVTILPIEALLAAAA